MYGTWSVVCGCDILTCQFHETFANWPCDRQIWWWNHATSNLMFECKQSNQISIQYMYMCMYMYMYMFMYMCVYMYMYRYMFMFTYMCMYIYIYIFIIYTHMCEIQYESDGTSSWVRRPIINVILSCVSRSNETTSTRRVPSCAVHFVLCIHIHIHMI